MIWGECCKRVYSRVIQRRYYEKFYEPLRQPGPLVSLYPVRPCEVRYAMKSYLAIAVPLYIVALHRFLEDLDCCLPLRALEDCYLAQGTQAGP